MTPFDPLLPMIASACVVFVLLHAAWHKLRAPEAFAADFAAYRLLPGLAELAARALPALEIAAALWLLSPWRAVGAVLAAGLLLLYGAAMAINLLRGVPLDCGCGGAPQPLSWWLVARNALCAALALLAGAPRNARVLEIGDLLLLSSAVFGLMSLYAVFQQLLRQMPGVERARSRS